MPSYSVEFERLWAKRSRELGRELTKDETRFLDGQQFEAWIEDGRLDELTRTIFANSGRSGGLDEIRTLGGHLVAANDIARLHTLFRGLLSRRVKAFYEWWPRALQGDAGCMLEAAQASAEAMAAYVEYFVYLDKAGLVAEREALRDKMKRFQAREPLASVLRNTSTKRREA